MNRNKFVKIFMRNFIALLSSFIFSYIVAANLDWHSAKLPEEDNGASHFSLLWNDYVKSVSGIIFHHVNFTRWGYVQYIDHDQI